MNRSPGGSAARIWPRREPLLLTLAALAMSVLALVLASPGAVRAQASGELACGQALSGPVFDKWTAMGGKEGPLGCPSARETAMPASPQGSSGREATFDAAAILWHGSGPHAGQTYVV